VGANQLIARFKRVRVADVVDALDRFGYHGSTLVSRDIRPLYPKAKLAGFAVTVRTRRAQAEIPSMSPEEYDRFAEEWYRLRANYDLFLSRAGPDVGFWGSTVALVAKAKGVEGVVVDGGVRDGGGAGFIKLGGSKTWRPSPRGGPAPLWLLFILSAPFPAPLSTTSG